jgi:CheY-like chemotaxis protein
VPRDSEPILIVDDSENDAALLKMGLEAAEVVNPLFIMSTYEEAVAYLSGHGQYHDRKAYPPPLIAFLDINMPGRSGFELLEWIRANESSKNLVVLMMSGSSSRTDIARAYRLGANSYLMKHREHEELVKTLRHFRTYWVELNHYCY